MQMKNMATSSVAQNASEAFLETAKLAGSAHLVLSVGNKA
jgi:hypothetical protein